MPVINLLSGAGLLLGIVVYCAILLVALSRRSVPVTVRRRLAFGAIMCLLGLIAGTVLRVIMTRSMPAAQFGTAIPILNLVQLAVHLSGIIVITSAAFMDRSAETVTDGTEVFAAPELSDNPYKPL